MKSVSVCVKVLIEIFKDLQEEERDFLINRIYDVLSDHGTLNGSRLHLLEVKFRDLVVDVEKIKDTKHVSLDQALSVLSERYPEFLKHDNLNFDFKIN